jgi:hypothetical protein
MSSVCGLIFVRSLPASSGAASMHHIAAARARRRAGERAEALLSGDYPSQLEARHGDSQCGK